MRFIPQRDYDLFQTINKELINDIIDLKVVVYKVNQKATKTNSYGEAPKRTYFQGVLIPCMYSRDPKQVVSDAKTINVTQTAEFYFLRQECQDRGIYPEEGDIIEWDSKYYEINTANESQLTAGRPEYRFSIVCKTHLTRSSGLQLEKPQV